jgi:hydrogenase expression/formation protein HypC
MCLGVPGRVVDWLDRDPLFARAEVEFGGVRREVHMACALEAEVGDYVIVHAGIAIGRIDEQEAARALREFGRIDEIENDGEEDDESWR